MDNNLQMVGRSVSCNELRIKTATAMLPRGLLPSDTVSVLAVIQSELFQIPSRRPESTRAAVEAVPDVERCMQV
jgi:hypothetical protein